MDYSSTINLPKTDFPMKAGLKEKEQEATAGKKKGKHYKHKKNIEP